MSFLIRPALFISMLLLHALSLTACGTIPGAGPFNDRTDNDAEIIVSLETDAYGEEDTLKYVLISTSKLLLDHLEQYQQSSPPEWPAYEDAKPLAINVGDSLNITIYESRTGGLFIPKDAGVRPGNFINLPIQVVDSTGSISVPYVGTFRVVGMTTAQVARFIVEKLQNRAIEPQVVVSYGVREGANVSVLGDVNSPTKFSINFSGERVLDAIARAGGPKFAGYDTFVTLQRDSKEMTIPLDDIIQNPIKNIFLNPGDVIYLFKQASTYSVFGASNGNGRYEHGRRELFLSEALGNSGGLNNLQADASEVYVFRLVDRDKVNSILLLEDPDRTLESFDVVRVPTLFRFNLREPSGFFYTQLFAMNDNDVVYIPDADTVDLNKFISVLSPTTSTSRNVRNFND